MREKEKRYGVYGVKDHERTRIGVFVDIEFVTKICEWELKHSGYEMMEVEDETI